MPSGRLRNLSPALFFFFLLALLASAPKERAANQLSRFDLVRSLVHEGTFAIDTYRQNTMDFAFANGHYYSNKGPGTALLALPVYAFNAGWQKLLGFRPADWYHWNLWFAELFSSCLPAVLLAFFFTGMARSWFPERRGEAWKAAYACSVASSVFPFSLTMWGHITSASFAMGALWCLENVRAGSRDRWAWLSGFAFTYAVSCDYEALVLFPFLVFYAFRKWRAGRLPGRFWPFAILGSLPPLLFLAFYHDRCFGGPLTAAPQVAMPLLPHDPLNYPVLGQLGWPSTKIFLGFLFGSERGAFLFSPILPLASLGWSRMWREGAERFWLSVAPFFLLALIFSGYIGHHGGGSSGPRYLLVAYPFFCLGLGAIRWGKIAHSLLTLGVLNSCAVVAVTVLSAGDVFVLRDNIWPFVLTDIYYAYDFLVLSLGCGMLWLIGSRVNWSRIPE